MHRPTIRVIATVMPLLPPTWSNYNGEDIISSITQYGKDEKSGTENISNSAYRYTYNVSGQFDYQNTFNEDHNVFGMILANAGRHSAADIIIVPLTPTWASGILQLSAQVLC